MQTFRSLSSPAMVAHSSAGKGSFSFHLTPIHLSFPGTEKVCDKNTASAAHPCTVVCVKAQQLAESLQTVLNSHLLMARILRE